MFIHVITMGPWSSEMEVDPLHYDIHACLLYLIIEFSTVQSEWLNGYALNIYRKSFPVN